MTRVGRKLKIQSSNSTAPWGRKKLSFFFVVWRNLSQKNDQGTSLFGRFLLEVGDDVSTLGGLLEASEGHLGALDVLFGVLKIVKEGLLGPDDAGVLVGIRVLVVGESTSSAAKETIQVGTLLVRSTLKRERERERMKKRVNIFSFFFFQFFFQLVKRHTLATVWH
ncbi:MAG: hypothetical protein Q8P67_26075 [archaeon]|nr:hypothetical protein [archaeon]